MKKVYIATLSVVTVLCIIVGTLAHVGGWFSIFPFGGDSSGSLDYAEDQPEFKSLKLEADVMSVTIRRGDKYHISYKASEKMAPKIKLKGDTLVVTQSSRGFNFFFDGNKKCELTLTIPEGVQLADADFDLDVGSLKMADLSVDHMKITTDVGNMEMNSCTGNRLEVESDVGNIDIRSSEFADTEIDTDVGNVYFAATGDLSRYALALATDIGKVTVDGNSYKRHFSQTASSTSDGHRLTVETDTGSIEIATSR